MSNPENQGAVGAHPAQDEVRDTLVPSDALPEPTPGDTLPPHDVAPAAPVLRRDPEMRARPGLALGAGLAVVVCAAAFLPALMVAVLMWPGTAPADGAVPAAMVRPQLDFAALRAAISGAALPPAAPPLAPAVIPGERPGEPDPSLHAFARLANRVYDTREVWRRAGQSGKELFRTATVDELGGDAFLKELQLGPRRFVWLRREARVLAPASAQVPDGIGMKDGTNDPGPKLFDGTLEGRPVRAIRTCVFGESYCLVDVVELAPAPAADAPAALIPDDGARLAAFDLAVTREAKKLEAWSPPAPVAAAASTRAPPTLALLAGLALAAGLVAIAVARLRGIAGTVLSASARLRAAAAGQATAAAPLASSAELAQLQAAVEAASAALGDGAWRAAQASRRRARLTELAEALGLAAGGTPGARVVASGDDDVALAALVVSVNVALERMAARPPTQ